MGGRAGRSRDRRGAVPRGAAARARAGLEPAGHVRRAQRDQHRAAGGRRRAAGPPDRRAARLRPGPPSGPRLRRPADQLGAGLRRGRCPRVQVPREQGRRRGRVHAADGVAHDGSRVLLRRHQPGRLPALRHRLHHHPRPPWSRPFHADKVLCSATYCLWALPDPGYIHVYDTTGVLTATRADVGLAERRPAGLATARRAAGPDGGLQRAGGRPPRRQTRPRCGGRRATSSSSTPTWQTARPAPWCGRTGAPPSS